MTIEPELTATPSEIGAYGAWAASITGRTPGAVSLRSGKFSDIDAWREAARSRVWERLGSPAPISPPTARVEWTGEYDGLHVERLSWQLPYGPRTEAVLLRPADARGPLPGLVGLHDHSGDKYFGWRKIARVEEQIHPMMQQGMDRAYGGVAWANELARRGWVVLVHDGFAFGSRRVRLADVIPAIRGSVTDPGPEERLEEIEAYNQWAGAHESIMAKSLFCAGTTWPAVFLQEDRAAVDVLCSRPEVDPNRIACGGLSGGGLRTVMLSGMDERIASCVCAGFFTTWQDFLLFKSHTHTWMTYIPLAPGDLDFPEIMALRAPKPALVLNCAEDPLFTLSEVKIAGEEAAKVYASAGAPEAFRLSHYPGGHKFDRPMQAEAFDWLEKTCSSLS